MRRLLPSLILALFAAAPVAAQTASPSDSVVIKSLPRDQRPTIAIRDLDFAAQLGRDDIQELSRWEGLAIMLGRSGSGTRMDAKTIMEQLAKQLTQMLTQAISETENFRIFERQQLGAATGEQDLGSSNRAAPGQATAQMGQLVTARYIVTGAISTFGKSTKRKGGVGGMLLSAAAGVKSESTEYEIGITLKVLDATTGENITTISADGSSIGNKSFVIAGGGVLGSVIGAAVGKSATGEREKRFGEAMQRAALAGAIRLVEKRESGVISR